MPLPAAMTYDNDDRLSSWNGQTTASDADGNLTTGPVGGAITNLTYDARNRLTAAGASTYGYDAENRRVSQTNAGVVTSYAHDPSGPLSRLLARSKGNATTRYVYDDTGLLLYEDAGGGGNAGLKTYHYDGRGSTVALVDASGQVSDRVIYGAYGETASRTGTTDTPFLFHGAWGVQSDSSNALLCMRARYYSVESRRFLNADPSSFNGGMNWYAFVGGDSTNKVDPFGLDAIYLNDSNAVHSQGHAAILVGNNETGFTFFAKNGDGPGPYGDGNNRDVVYQTYGDFIKSPDAARFDRAVHIPTSPDQDFNMTVYGDSHYRRPFSGIHHNCGDLVEGILGSGGITEDGTMVGITRPNTIYDDLSVRPGAIPWPIVHHP